MALNPGRHVAPRRDWTSVLKYNDLDIGEHLFRFIEGGDTIHTIMWPTEAVSNQSGQVEPTWRSVRLNPEDKNTVLDRLGAKEMAIRQSYAVERGAAKGRPNCTFNRRSTYLFAIFDKRVPDHHINPKPVLYSANWTQAKQITEYNTTPKPTDPAVLKWGPMNFYDMYSVKFLEESKGVDRRSADQKTRYRVDVVENPWAGRVPLEWRQGVPPDFDWVNEGVFTQAELDAIRSADLDFTTETAPVSEEEILAMLEQYPIKLDYITRNDDEIFPEAIRPAMTNAIEQLGLPLLGANAGTMVSMPALPPRRTAPVSSPAPVKRPAKHAAQPSSLKDMFLPGDLVWCDEDGEAVDWKVVEATADLVKVTDGANFYDVPASECHLKSAATAPKPVKKAAVKAPAKAPAMATPVAPVTLRPAPTAAPAKPVVAKKAVVKKAPAKKVVAAAAELVEGSIVWCDEDGEGMHYTLKAFDGADAHVTGADGTVYVVPRNSLHLVATMRDQQVSEWAEGEALPASF